MRAFFYANKKSAHLKKKMAEELGKIHAHIDIFQQLILCLNVLGRLKLDMKVITQKTKGPPWRIRIQENSLFSFSGVWTRIWRTWSKDHAYGRDDNIEYIRAMIQDVRDEFTLLFQYMSKYIVRNNELAMQHWDTKELSKDIWMTNQHASPSMKPDEPRTFQISYRLCKCKDCILSSERMVIIQVANLLVQALASMVNAASGLEFLKQTYDGDDAVIARIQSAQTDLGNMSKQYGDLVILDRETNAKVIGFDRPYITKSDDAQLP